MEISSLKEAIQILEDIEDEYNSVPTSDEEALRKTFAYGCGGKRFPFGIWFRGENNYPFEQYEPLTPSIFRSKDKVEEDYYDETSIYNLMPTRISELNNITSIIDRLATMQHYGIPTRLLDWSESLLVGLYFACSTSFDIDSTLYVINARKLNGITGMQESMVNLHMENDYGTKFRFEFITVDNAIRWYKHLIDKYPNFKWNWVEKYGWIRDEERAKYNDDIIKGMSTPIGVIPNKINRRMIVQNSVFTLHGGKRQSALNGSLNISPDEPPIPEPTGILDLPNQDSFLKMFKISAKNKEKIKRQLFAVGIHESSLFPEIESQSSYLKKIF